MKVFTRGQRSRLDALTDLKDETFTIGLSIEASSSIVFDFCCFGLDENQQLADDRYFIFYNQLRSPQGEIEMSGPEGIDRERFFVDLKSLPPSVRRLVFTATIDGAQTMSQIGRGFLRVTAGENEVVRYEFSGADFTTEKAVIIAEIYWKDAWRFGAVGQGFSGGLSTLLAHFGGEEEETSAPAPPQESPIHSPASVPPAPVSPPAPVISAPASPAPRVVPIESTTDLQNRIDTAPDGSTLALPGGEHQGPITIRKALTLDGRKSTLWTRGGPVLTIAAPGVTLRDLEIEVTVPEEGEVALHVESGCTPTLQNVAVRGKVSGLENEDGTWRVPQVLDLGTFAPRAQNRFVMKLEVPVACRLSTPVAGVVLSPSQVEAGEHEVEILVRDVPPDALIAGKIEVSSSQLSRAIAVAGSTLNAQSIAPIDGKVVGGS